MSASDPIAGAAVFTPGEREYIRRELDQFFGLMRLEATPWPPRLFFTEAGLAALRAMMADRRLANPKTFAHVRQGLGIDPGPEEP
jgi:hypothetical protein